MKGIVVEIGDLEGFQKPTPGIRLEHDGKIITLCDLDRQVLAGISGNWLYREVELSIAPAPTSPET